MKQNASLLILAGLWPVVGVAQEAEPGGAYVTFDFDQAYEASTDRDLTTVDDEDGFDTVTSLGLSAVTETRSQRLSADAATSLRLSEGEQSFEEITGRLAYSRESADAAFDISLEAFRTDIAFLRDVSDFIDADGELDLPDDFGDLVGSGIRRLTIFATGLEWGETAPVGYELFLSLQTLRYEDASADLLDADTGIVSAGLRLNLNEVTTGNISLGFSQTDEVGEPLEESTTLTGALTFARPLGDLTTSISATRDEEEDVFLSASVERVYALPNSRLNGALGLAEDEGGEARLTAEIGYSLPLPESQIDLSANHTFTPGDDRSNTTLRAGYMRDLNEVNSIRLALDFAQESATDGSDRIATGTLSASYGISLTDVWQLDIGAQTSRREDDGVRTRSNTIFLAIGRPFTWRP